MTRHEHLTASPHYSLLSSEKKINNVPVQLTLYYDLSVVTIYFSFHPRKNVTRIVLIYPKLPNSLLLCMEECIGVELHLPDLHTCTPQFLSLYLRAG